MAKSNPLRLSTFKLSLIAIPLNLAAGLAIIAFVFFSTQSLSDRRVDHAIEAERHRLMEDVLGQGPHEISETLRRRISEERGSARLYLLIGNGAPGPANFSPITENDLPQPGHYARIQVNRDGQEIPARLYAIGLAEGTTLLIGRNLSEQIGFRIIVEDSLALAVAAAVIFAVIAGLIASRAVLRRLSVINRTATTIFHGKLEERVPLMGGDDEFNDLARNINLMLDRISDLMRVTREVTDNVAHDLRTPLNRMRGRLELALLPDTPRVELEEAVTASLEEADALVATFEALLTIARLDNGVAPDFATVDLASLAEDLLDYFAPLAEERDLLLCAEPLVPIELNADRHLLFQAFSNAVDNAIRYTPPGGRVAISVRSAGEGAVFSVADSGPGIPEERRQDVLRRFFRLDASRHEAGTGLGLSVVEAIARHHGAKLVFEDNWPGLRLSMEFPLPPPKRVS